MFELLMSADMMVPDPDGMTQMLVDKLGIYKHERWRQAFDNHPYIAHFLRVHKSLAVSPTRIEPQWHLDRPNPVTRCFMISWKASRISRATTGPCLPTPSCWRCMGTSSTRWWTN